MTPERLIRAALVGTAAVVLLLLTPAPAAAYVGPGAGFAFLTSFLAVFVSGLLAWPRCCCGRSGR